MSHKPVSRVLSSAIILGVVVAAIAERPAPSAQGASPTFSKDVAPIVFKNCAMCHRPGELAPFNLLTYDDVKQHARRIATVTKSRFMPPWKPEPPEPGMAFQGERRLTDAEIQTLQRWVDAGSPEGDRRDMPPAPVFASTWHLGEPDLVVTMPEPFDVPADGKDVFRNIVLKVPTTTLRYVQAIEFRPGNPRVLHHARVLVDETDASRWRDAQDPGPGFGGMEAPEAHFPDGHFLGWAPGKLAAKEALPWPLAPGTDLVIQMHLRPTGKPERLQASVGLYFSDKPPAASPVMLRLGSRTIDIPAGESAYAINDSYTLPVDATALRIYPHAHYLGHDMTVTAALPGGATKTLLHIAAWDFNWQDEYEYAQPVALPRGTVVSMKYTYDNSAANIHNPRKPPVRVRFGPDATDEMGELLLQLLPAAADFATLRADVGRKVLAGDLAGDEKRVADAPGDPLAHNALGVAYFQSGRVDEAVKQFDEAIRLKPDEPTAHFNLSLIGMTQGRLDDAAQHLLRAIAARPDYAEAHNNLGIILMRQGTLDPAILQFREVLRIHPESADAHYNLGRALLAAGQVAEAVVHLRQASVSTPDMPSMLDDLAWILATSDDDAVRNPKDAVAFAERAAGLTGRKNPSILDTLAAAYAAAGQFEPAAQAEREAFDLASDANASDMAIEFLKRLDLYRAKKAYREDAGVKGDAGIKADAGVK
jgi:Flp pilus assembly protein TadD